jgi:tetratricopeptide (TPR) repeat protein
MGSRVNFRSEPEGATVFVKPVGSGALKQIGVTPFTADSHQLNSESGGAGPIVVEYQKEGYRNARVLITELSSLDLSVNMDLELANPLEDPAVLNKHIDQAFEAQRLLRAGRPAEALRLIAEAKKEAPNLSIFYEIEGGIHYLEGDYKSAFDAYKVAVSLNPNSPSAVRMRDKLVERLGAKADRATAGINAGIKGAAGAGGP